jgi:hypothetical protein
MKMDDNGDADLILFKTPEELAQEKRVEEIKRLISGGHQHVQRFQSQSFYGSAHFHCNLFLIIVHQL